MWFLICPFPSSWVRKCTSGSTSTLRSVAFVIGLLSILLLSPILVLFAVPYLLSFLNCRIESKDYIQVSRLELIDEFSWILLWWTMDYQLRLPYRRIGSAKVGLRKMQLEFLSTAGDCDSPSECSNHSAKNAICSSGCAEFAFCLGGFVWSRDRWWDPIPTISELSLTWQLTC